MAKRFATYATSLILAAILSGCSNHSMSSSLPVHHTPLNITQALWVANGTDVLEFLPSQFVNGESDPTPHLTNASASFGSPQGVAFDADGNLWVVDAGNANPPAIAAALYKFSAQQVAALGSNQRPIPVVTIHYSGFGFPQQAVFDSKGDLWVSDNGSNAVFEFTPTLLASSGSNVTPNFIINSNPSFAGPIGLAFSPSGKLFVANNGATSIYGFDQSTLPTSRGTFTLRPDVVLSDNGNNTIQGPWGLEFDAGGNLWSSNAGGPNTIVEFTASQLQTTGTPAATVTISPTTDAGEMTLSTPNGLAFDSEGDLSAASSFSPFGIALYAHGQLGTSNAIVPQILFIGPNSTIDAPAGIVFGPVVN